MIAGTFWLREALAPAAAWTMITTLRSGGPTFTPAWFRAGTMPGPRRLGRRSESLVVECLTQGKEIALLRHASATPRTLLRSAVAGGTSIITLAGPPVQSMQAALELIHLIKALCDVIRPVAGVVDESEEQPRGGSGVRGGQSSPPVGAFPGWLTILGPEKVIAIGAGRLLMAPVFLIDTLADGGLLIAGTPLPGGASAGAGRRSSAQAAHLQEQGWWPGVPLIEPEELPALT